MKLREDLEDYFKTLFTAVELYHTHINGREGNLKPDVYKVITEEVLKIVAKHQPHSVE